MEAKGTEILGRNIRPEKEYKVKTYDFKRPDKFSKDQMRTLSMMHETFARLASTALSSKLRLFIKMHVASVDQLTYEEFIRSIPHPTVLAPVRLDPLKGPMLLELDPSLGFAGVERLFGGVGRKTQPERAVTDVEMKLLEELFSQAFLANLRESWANIIAMQPQLGQMETNKQFCQIVPPTEMVVLVTFETKIGDAVGMMNFCYPYLTIEPIVSKLSAQWWYSSVRRGKAEWNPSDKVPALKAESAVYYEGETLPLRDLWKLKRGTLVKLPSYGKGAARLVSGGTPVASLERREKNGGYCFDIAATTAVSETDRKILALSETVGKSEKIKKMAEEMQLPLEVLSSDLKSGMREINLKLQEITTRQDELVDQVLFSAPDREVSEKGYGSEKPWKPFGYVRMADLDNLLNIIGGEHPQTISLVLSYLEPHMASQVLSRLPEDLQPDVVQRIAAIDRTDPKVLELLERWVQERFRAMGAQDAIAAGGIERVVDILNTCSRSVEKHVVSAMDKSDPELSEEIKKRMFVFEDIVLLDDVAIRKVFEKADRDDLLKSVKAVIPEVAEKVYSNLPKGDVEAFKADAEKIGRVRLSDVEAAQQRIVSVIRRLEEEGGIIVARSDEPVV